MIIDVLEQWRVWRHRIDRVRIALPQGYTTACIWVCILLWYLGVCVLVVQIIMSVVATPRTDLPHCK